MFAKIEVILPELVDVMLIPITAVQYATFGDSVFVIEEEKVPAQQDITDTSTGANPERPLVARQQFIQLGQTRGDYVVVTKGLSVGQKIASAGVFKLRNGAPVAINNTVAPEYSLNPVVEDQ